MGELHLDIIVDRMSREFKVDCNVGKPQVAYRETIRKEIKSRGFFKRQSGGRGQYGDCWLELIPQEQGKGYEFENKVVGGAIPKEYIGSVEAGVKEAMETGVLAGFPMVDIKVAVYDGSYHEVDSSEMAFKIAGSMGFKEGARKAIRFSSNRTRKSKLSFLKIHGRRHRRPQLPPWSCRRYGNALRCRTYQRLRTAGRNVWLCNGFAFPYAGPWRLYDDL